MSGKVSESAQLLRYLPTFSVACSKLQGLGQSQCESSLGYRSLITRVRYYYQRSFEAPQCAMFSENNGLAGLACVQGNQRNHSQRLSKSHLISKQTSFRVWRRRFLRHFRYHIGISVILNIVLQSALRGEWGVTHVMWPVSSTSLTQRSSTAPSCCDVSSLFTMNVNAFFWCLNPLVMIPMMKLGEALTHKEVFLWHRVPPSTTDGHLN